MLHDMDAVNIVGMGTSRGPLDEGRRDPSSADELIDETEREASPASDPPSFWAGPDRLPIDPDEQSDHERTSRPPGRSPSER